MANFSLFNPTDQELLQSLGLENLSADEKQKVLPPLMERLSEVAMETAVEAMNEDEKSRFMKALDDPATAEEKIAEIASGIPGLKERIDDAVKEEILTLRIAKGLL